MPVGKIKSILSPREELRGAVDLLHRAGVVEKLDRDMMGGVLDLRELTVSDVMVHRTKMVMINAEDPPHEIIDTVMARQSAGCRSGATARTILSVSCTRRICCARCTRTAATPPRSTSRRWRARPGSSPILRRSRSNSRRSASARGPLVRGRRVRRAQGLVTIKDIIEEIVGDITDEHEMLLPGVRTQPDGSANVDGAVPMRDLNRAMDWHLPDDEATTIAGLVIHEARSIPEAGQNFTFHGFRFNVLRKSRNRITSLRVTPPPAAEVS